MPNPYIDDESRGLRRGYFGVDMAFLGLTLLAVVAGVVVSIVAGNWFWLLGAVAVVVAASVIVGAIRARGDT